MTYTEKELDQFLHGISLSLLSKKSAQHWRYDEETAKEIEWLEALERKVRADKADRKTEQAGDNLSAVEDEPLTCDGNCWMKKQNGEWLCEHCQREPKDEPQIIACPIVDDDAWIYEDEPRTERSNDAE